VSEAKENLGRSSTSFFVANIKYKSSLNLFARSLRNNNCCYISMKMEVCCKYSTLLLNSWTLKLIAELLFCCCWSFRRRVYFFCALCSITQHLWEQNSHWMRRVEPRLAHILRSQTKFCPQQRYEQDKRGEIVFGRIRVDDAWMAL